MQLVRRSVIFCALFAFSAAMGQGSRPASKQQPPKLQALVEAGAHYFFKTGGMADGLDAETESVVSHQRLGFAWSGEAGVMLNGLHQVTVMRTQSSRSKDFMLGLIGPGGGLSIPASSTENLAYTGLNYGVQVPFGKGGSARWLAVMKAGLGVWNYENNLTVNRGNPAEASTGVSENGFGYMTGLRMGYHLVPGLALFAGTDVLGGSVKIDGERENLGQIRLSTTLRLTLSAK